MRGTFRLALINTPEGVSPLRFRSWIRIEVQQVQMACRGDDLAIVRIFLLERLRLQITQKKIDRLVQELVDRFPSVLRIELHPIQKPLTPEELAKETEIANADMKQFVAALESGQLDAAANPGAAPAAKTAGGT